MIVAKQYLIKWIRGICKIHLISIHVSDGEGPFSVLAY